MSRISSNGAYSNTPRWRVFLREQEDHMRKVRLALIGTVALSLVAIGVASAQQNDNRKKPPKQTHDKGIDDPEPAPASKTGERNVEAVTIIERADGIRVGILDESFEDALVASVNPDGSITYRCLHGLPAASKHVASTPPPPVSAAPRLEEK
jgi:hypothetical protein